VKLKVDGGVAAFTGSQSTAVRVARGRFRRNRRSVALFKDVGSFLDPFLAHYHRKVTFLDLDT